MISDGFCSKHGALHNCTCGDKIEDKKDALEYFEKQYRAVERLVSELPDPPNKEGSFSFSTPYAKIKHFMESRADQPAQVDNQAALDATIIYSEEERDGMDAAFHRAAEKGKGHYETLFAVASYILRKRALTATKHEGVTYHDTDYNSPMRPKRLEYTMCGKIYAVQENGERHMFMDVRGWGYLTGGGAKNLPREEATTIQDKWANEVVNLWNEATENAQGDLKVIPELEKACQSYEFDIANVTAEQCDAVLAGAKEHLKRQKGR